MNLIGVKAFDYHEANNPSNELSPLKKFTSKLREITLCEKFRSKLLKLIKNSIILYDEIFKSNHFSIAPIGIASALEVLILKIVSLPKKIDKIHKAKRDKLKLTSLLIDLGTTPISILKTLDLFKVVDLGKFSLLLGKIPVAGSVLARVLPFSNISSILEIIQASIEIAISSKRIIAKKQDIAHVDSKLNLWKDVLAKGSLSEELLNSTISSKKRKIKNISIEILAFEYKIARYQDSINKSQEKLEKIQDELKNCRGVNKTAFKIKAAIAEKSAAAVKRRIFREEKVKTDFVSRLDDLKTASNALMEIKQSRDNLNMDAVKKFAEIKIEKWMRKNHNHKQVVKKEGGKIAINTILIICLVASIVLGSLALTAVPFVSIPLCIGFLIIPLLGFGLNVWKKLHKDKVYNSVPFSLLLPINSDSGDDENPNTDGNLVNV